MQYIQFVVLGILALMAVPIVAAQLPQPQQPSITESIGKVFNDIKAFFLNIWSWIMSHFSQDYCVVGQAYSDGIAQDYPEYKGNDKNYCYCPDGSWVATLDPDPSGTAWYQEPQYYCIPGYSNLQSCIVHSDLEYPPEPLAIGSCNCDMGRTWIPGDPDFYCIDCSVEPYFC